MTGPLSRVSPVDACALRLKGRGPPSPVMDMAQELTCETIVTPSEEDREVPEALIVCRGCGHLVPKTMLCLWCGSPIMFRMPRSLEPDS